MNIKNAKIEDRSREMAIPDKSNVSLGSSPLLLEIITTNIIVS